MIAVASSSGYAVRLSRAREDIIAAQCLRFEVFNLELGEGLAESAANGRDADAFDTQCDHLLVQSETTGEVVGTYRLQTGEMAGAGIGYYSEREFDFSPYETEREGMLELGRACIRADHRKRAVLDLLWRGIAAYAREKRSRYLIGCSSLNSQNPADGWGVYHRLKDKHLARRELRSYPTEKYFLPPPLVIPEQVGPPKLFAAYLGVGATIAGPPALDHEFGSIDFLTILDLQQIAPAGRKHFFRE